LVVENNIRRFAEQFGEGNLYLKVFLESDTNTPCSIESFELETSEFSGD